MRTRSIVGRVLALALVVLGVDVGASLAADPTHAERGERQMLTLRIPALAEEPDDCCAIPREDYVKAVVEHLGHTVLEVRLSRLEVVVADGSQPIVPAALVAALKQFGLPAEIVKGP